MKYGNNRFIFKKWLGRRIHCGTAILALLWSMILCVPAVSGAETEAETDILAEEGGQDDLLLRLYEANKMDMLLERHERYDRTSTFFFSDGSSRQVYSFCDEDTILRLQEDMAILAAETDTRACRRDPQTWEWTDWEIHPQDWPDFSSQAAGAFLYDPDEVVDLSVQIDQYLHIETSADVVLHFPLLEQLGFTAGAEDWISCTYDVDPETLEVAIYNSALMHPDGTSDPLNTIVWRYGGSVPQEEPQQSMLEAGVLEFFDR